MSTFANSEDPMKFSIMLHFIRIYTVCKELKKIFRQKNTIYFEKYNLTLHRYVQWTIPSVLYKTRRKNPLVYKGLKGKYWECCGSVGRV